MVRLPTYIRPELTKLDITDKGKLESMQAQGEKLAENMWQIDMRRRYGSRGFISSVLIKSSIRG